MWPRENQRVRNVNQQATNMISPGGGKLPLKAWYRWAVWWILKIPAARENQAWKAYPGLGKFCLKLNILSLKLFMEPISCTYFVKILHSRPACREIFVKMHPCLGIFPLNWPPQLGIFPLKWYPQLGKILEKHTRLAWSSVLPSNGHLPPRGMFKTFNDEY